MSQMGWQKWMSVVFVGLLLWLQRTGSARSEEEFNGDASSLWQSPNAADVEWVSAGHLQIGGATEEAIKWICTAIEDEILAYGYSQEEFNSVIPVAVCTLDLADGTACLFYRLFPFGEIYREATWSNASKQVVHLAWRYEFTRHKKIPTTRDDCIQVEFKDDTWVCNQKQVCWRVRIHIDPEHAAVSVARERIRDNLYRKSVHLDP